MHRFIAFVAVVAALITATALREPASAAAASPKHCGSVRGPKVRLGPTTTARYGVYGVAVNCSFAKSTVRAILKRHLPNSKTPVRTKAPAGWICVAQEVDHHVAVAGHCQQHRRHAFAWVATGLHP